MTSRDIEAAVLVFCSSIYEATCATPSRIVLKPVSFDTLVADMHSRHMVRLDDGVDGTYGVVLETGHGRVIIERGQA